MSGECYGCGKKLSQFGETGYFWIAGKQRSFCPGRYHQPKKPCVTKAIFKLSEEHLCPLCGCEWSSYGEPCSDCEKTLKVGRETRETTVNLRDEVVSEILASFLRFDSWSSGDMSWPFRIVTRRGDDQHKLSFQLRKVVHDLWKKWGELHYAKGLVEGSNILARLQSGELGLTEYNSLREKESENIPVTRDGTERLALQVVEEAKKIQKWNGQSPDVVTGLCPECEEMVGSGGKRPCWACLNDRDGCISGLINDGEDCPSWSVNKEFLAISNSCSPLDEVCSNCGAVPPGYVKHDDGESGAT